MNIDGTVCLLQTGIMAGPVVEISVLRIFQHETGEYYYVQCHLQCVLYTHYGGVVENSVPRIIWLQTRV